MTNSNTTSKQSLVPFQARVIALTDSSKSLALVAMLLLMAPGVWSQPESAPTYGEVAPLFQQRCVMCHSGEAAAAGLRLDSLDAIQKGSPRGPVVIASNPADSELIRRIRGISQPRMPMTGPPFLSDSEIELLERWIAGGLRRGAPTEVQPRQQTAFARPASGEPVTYLHVAPIFARRCAKCHTDDGLMGPAPEGFRLTSYQSTLSAGDRVRVVPGNPSASELVRRVRGQARPRMPFDGPPYLEQDEIQLIEDWVAQGARSSDGVKAQVPVGARVRLHGTLESRHQLDGLDLIVAPGTRIDKKPRPGDYVQVRGRLDAAGNVRVERLRRR